MMLVLIALAAGSALLALVLFVYASRREHTEDVQMRLRAGDDATVAAGVSIETRVENALIRNTCYLLWRSGFDVKPGTAAVLIAAAVALVPVALLVFGLLAGALVVAGLSTVVLLVLSARAARRRAKIVAQLPAYLEAVIRVLAAGNTLEEAIASAAREAVEPSRSLFLSIARQVRLGAPVDIVLSEASEIHQVKDLRVIALAANINRRYGGTLRNVFRSLIQAIRMREQAARELSALTAETRFSALVLAVMPVGISVFIFIRNRAFYDDMLATTSGKVTLVLAVVLQIIGMFVIWRMMKSTQENG